MNFTLPDSVTVSGTDYPIRTDFRVILEIFVMLDDPDLNDADKTEALIRMFYIEDPRKDFRKRIEEEPNEVGLLRKRKTGGMTELSEHVTEANGYEAQSDVEAALRAFTDFVDPRRAASPLGRHGSQGKKSSARLIDWQQDFDLMVAPINHILGFECRAAEYLHWRTFFSAYLEIPPERVFARVLRIREKLRTGKKLEKYERTWYNKNRDLVHLRPKFSKAEEELIEAWT